MAQILMPSLSQKEQFCHTEKHNLHCGQYFYIMQELNIALMFKFSQVNTDLHKTDSHVFFTNHERAKEVIVNTAEQTSRTAILLYENVVL
jgi:hypothetical protein